MLELLDPLGPRGPEGTEQAPLPGHPLQVHERNSGRDPFPVFLKRAPLPREKPRGTTMTGRIPKSLCYR